MTGVVLATLGAVALVTWIAWLTWRVIEIDRGQEDQTDILATIQHALLATPDDRDDLKSAYQTLLGYKPEESE